MAKTIFNFNVEEYRPGKFIITLPHQCSKWEIQSDEKYDVGVSKKEAVRRLELFIIEAQKALEQLKTL